MSGVLLPGATLGVLGGGQLGRMFALAARRMGYRVVVFCGAPTESAAQVADKIITGAWEDEDALRRLASECQVTTLEWENIPAHTLSTLERWLPVRPGGEVLAVAQDRIREKQFLAEQGLPTVEWRPVRDEVELLEAASAVGCPAILKTSRSGYDGKGQIRIAEEDQALWAWKRLGQAPCVWERFTPLEREVSVVAARGVGGEVALWRPTENLHHRHILDLSLFPAELPGALEERAGEMARAIAEALGAVGVLCVEFFVTQGGALLVNELAPRPHNSGHLTIEASATSQFEQQVRATAGLPLGDPSPITPAAAMANLLGELWSHGEPDWAAALAVPGVSLHLYGKGAPQPGRKMGHLTATAPTRAQAQERVLGARARLLRHS